MRSSTAEPRNVAKCSLLEVHDTLSYRKNVKHDQIEWNRLTLLLATGSEAPDLSLRLLGLSSKLHACPY